ncbi:MAG: metallophosphoesterase [Bacteroidaceae bacterium]|nr:metallophosphoesterase [Bacteroidaceae bacterium]
MDRREFLKRSALLSAALATSDIAQASDILQPYSGHPEGKNQDAAEEALPHEEAGKGLLASAPMLQNYAETSIGIAFAVSDLANGYVIYGRRPDLSDGTRVMCGGFRTTELSDRVVQVRLTGLKPSTAYYYRIGADRIRYKGGYDIKVTGNEEDPHIYRFTTAGSNSRAHFCVINDTHAKWEVIDRTMEKIALLAPSCVVWNGDASNVEETIEAQTRIFFTPEIARRDYAAQTPYLFCPGNHDLRGMANRHLERVWMYRQPDERPSRDWDLGRNFALRMGEVAMIGLDTGEDKLDTNPKFAGTFNSQAYREAQTTWLRDVLRRPDIAKAPYLVAFCHIPLFDPDPKRNPGDVAPADTAPQYDTDYAMWQRTCAHLWGPLLEKAHCQLVITAHQHSYRYDAPTATRPWAQIVGGGPNLKLSRQGEFPTVIEGEVQGGRFQVTVHNLLSGQVQQVMTFDRRRKK